MTITDHVAQIERFLDDTIEARELSEKCRDYFDHKQWTAAEERTLKARGQAPIVVNRLRPKIKGLVGLYSLRNTDPKAYARTQKHEQASNAVTDALRFISDNNDFEEIKRLVAEDFFIEGYGGAMRDVVMRKGEPYIRINHLPWDRIYFDSHSRKKDFKDARYMGFYMWVYREQANEMFPDVNVDSAFSESGYTDETTEDRPRWVSKSRDRLRLAFHFYIEKGVWKFAVFTEGLYFIEPQDSPYFDEDGNPTNPIELVCANIDRDNRRYGEAAGFLDQQDELNHRRSKFLHYNDQNQTWSRRGAVKDIAKLKRESKKPDGHMEFDGDEYGKDFGFRDTTQAQNGQIALYQDAKAELDSVSYNAQLAGERQSGDLSGVAIDKLQSAGTIELNQDYALLANWERREYEQMWAGVKQHWNEEKWVRITDDQDNLRWVGFNTPVKAQQWLEEQINDESLDFATRQQAAASYTFLMQAAQNPETAQAAQQQLDAPVDVSNPIPELEVDITIDQSFDVINMQQDQFNKIVQFAQSSQDIDIIELIEMSDLRNKDELIDKIEKRRQQAAQAAGNVAEMESKKLESEVMVNATNADKNQAEADQKKIENELLINQPDRVSSVSV